ncbi:MAG: DeoR/GlpR transcriptional regulator [Alphaproteobacteria bacterium]|nr:MAG: DeoR/GlpR transcriptional regulator [Alphaproteobacteria bacterium]
MLASTRQTRTRRAGILNHLRQSGRASVEELAALFATTPQTIRKDLNVLAGEGRVIRFHGGASLLAGVEYTGFEQRRNIAREEKERIGRCVASRIPGNTVVLINAGTTTAAVARRMDAHAGVRLVTDSVMMANETRGFPGLTVMVPGGVVRPSDGTILGETAIEFIRQFRADIAVIGAAAVAADGALLDYDLREAAVARAMIESARNVILAIDGSKYNRPAPVCIGHLRQVHSVVTDKGAPPALGELCAAMGVGLTLV